MIIAVIITIVQLKMLDSFTQILLITVLSSLALGCTEHNCNFTLDSNNGKLQWKPCSNNCSIIIKSKEGTKLKFRFNAEASIGCELQVFHQDHTLNIKDLIYQDTYRKQLPLDDNYASLRFSCPSKAKFKVVSVQWDVSDLQTEEGIDKLTKPFSKKHLALTILGLLVTTVVLICCVVCLCKKLRSFNVLKQRNSIVVSVPTVETASSPSTKEIHTQARESVHKPKEDVTPEGVGDIKIQSYDEITDDLLSPVSPERLEKITEEGYLSMTFEPHMQQYDVPIINKPVPPPQQNKPSPFRAISALFHGKRSEGEKNEYTNFHSRPLGKLKDVRSYNKRGRVPSGQSASKSESWITDTTKWSID